MAAKPATSSFIRRTTAMVDPSGSQTSRSNSSAVQQTAA
jgi:hypothetical protein